MDPGQTFADVVEGKRVDPETEVGGEGKMRNSKEVPRMENIEKAEKG